MGRYHKLAGAGGREQRYDPKMTTSREYLYKKALELDESERAALAGMILDSLDQQADEGVEPAWLAEIERRMDELDSGAVESIPWQSVRARLRRRPIG
jgi:putative addiction module component (TIGR02574 family)